jgi:hypothetical protein
MQSVLKKLTKFPVAEMSTDREFAMSALSLDALRVGERPFEFRFKSSV